MRRCPDCNLANTDEAVRCLRCNVALDPPQGMLVDDRYAVEREVGRGSMGVVYRARDVRLKRTVALKLMSRDLAANATFVERFRREANALASIHNDHVVQVYSMGEHDGVDYYAMEYIEGRNLEQIVREHIKHGTQLPVYRALMILREVAIGLDAVHVTGLVHRDVKPANIVIEDRTGRPVLLDFGLARPAAQESAQSTATVGTPGYMAPEQIAHDDELGPPADVYALGCTAFEVLTGAAPFEGKTSFAVMHKHLYEPAPLLSSRRPELARLDPIIGRAIEKSPGARYETAAAFGDALDACAQRWRSLGAPLPAPLTDTPARLVDALHVLIVDDDPYFCRIATKAALLAITDTPVRVVEASSGVRALTACLEQAPDVVVLDYDMPGANGIDTLSELRAIPRAGQATVLVVSYALGEVERWRFSVLGVKDFLAKPVVFGALVDAIRRLAEFAGTSVAPTSPALDSALAPTPLVQESRLPTEVFLLLLGVGWADGRLDDAERDAVLAAAEAEGFDGAELESLRRAALQRVDLGDVDTSRLRTHERRYVYAVARWIALIDGRFTEREAAALRVLGFALNMSQRAQTEIDAMVHDVTQASTATTGARATLLALREATRRGATEIALAR